MWKSERCEPVKGKEAAGLAACSGLVALPHDGDGTVAGHVSMGLGGSIFALACSPTSFFSIPRAAC